MWSPAAEADRGTDPEGDPVRHPEGDPVRHPVRRLIGQGRRPIGTVPHV